MGLKKEGKKRERKGRKDKEGKGQTREGNKRQVSNKEWDTVMEWIASLIHNGLPRSLVATEQMCTSLERNFG